MSDQSKGSILVLLSALCFSTSGTLQALAPVGATPLAIIAVRMILGASFLYLWAFAVKKLTYKIKELPWKTLLECSFWLLAAQYFFFTGMKENGVAVGTVLSLGSVPIWSALIRYVSQKEIPTFRWLLATSLSIFGVILIKSEFTNTTIADENLLLSLIGGFCYASYIFKSSKIPHKIPSELTIASVMLMVGIFLIPFLWFINLSWMFSSWFGIFICLALGLITAGAAFVMLLEGTRRTCTSTAATLSLAEPMCAAILGIFFLDEEASFHTIAGILLMLMTVLLLLKEKNNNRASNT